MRMKRFSSRLLGIILSFPVQAADVPNVTLMTPDLGE